LNIFPYFQLDIFEHTQGDEPPENSNLHLIEHNVDDTCASEN